MKDLCFYMYHQNKADSRSFLPMNHLYGLVLRSINHSVQALITYSVALVSHVIALICIAMLRRRLILCSVLAMMTRQELTENNIKHTKHVWARRDGSKRLLNDMCEISAVINLANVAMKKLLLDLQCLQRNRFCFKLRYVLEVGLVFWLELVSFL